MNANELADKRHDCQTFTELLVWGMDAEEMLRQQQAEIDSIIEKNKPEIEKANAYIKALEDEIEALKKQCVKYEILIASWGEK